MDYQELIDAGFSSSQINQLIKFNKFDLDLSMLSTDIPVENLRRFYSLIEDTAFYEDIKANIISAYFNDIDFLQNIELNFYNKEDLPYLIKGNLIKSGLSELKQAINNKDICDLIIKGKEEHLNTYDYSDIDDINIAYIIFKGLESDLYLRSFYDAGCNLEQLKTIAIILNEAKNEYERDTMMLLGIFNTNYSPEKMKLLSKAFAMDKIANLEYYKKFDSDYIKLLMKIDEYIHIEELIKLPENKLKALNNIFDATGSAGLIEVQNYIIYDEPFITNKYNNGQLYFLANCYNDKNKSIYYGRDLLDMIETKRFFDAGHDQYFNYNDFSELKPKEKCMINNLISINCSLIHDINFHKDIYPQYRQLVFKKRKDNKFKIAKKYKEVINELEPYTCNRMDLERKVFICDKSIVQVSRVEPRNSCKFSGSLCGDWESLNTVFSLDNHVQLYRIMVFDSCVAWDDEKQRFGIMHLDPDDNKIYTSKEEWGNPAAILRLSDFSCYEQFLEDLCNVSDLLEEVTADNDVLFFNYNTLNNYNLRNLDDVFAYKRLSDPNLVLFISKENIQLKLLNQLSKKELKETLMYDYMKMEDIIAGNVYEIEDYGKTGRLKMEQIETVVSNEESLIAQIEYLFRDKVIEKSEFENIEEYWENSIDLENNSEEER